MSFNAWEQGQRLVSFLIILITALFVVLGVTGAEFLNLLIGLDWSEKFSIGLGSWLAILLLIITPVRMWKASQTTTDEVVLAFIERAIRTGRMFSAFVEGFPNSPPANAFSLMNDWQSGVSSELKSYRPYLAQHFMTGPKTPVNRFSEEGNFTLEGVLTNFENGVSALIEIRDRIDASR